MTGQTIKECIWEIENMVKLEAAGKSTISLKNLNFMEILLGILNKFFECPPGVLVHLDSPK